METEHVWERHAMCKDCEYFESKELCSRKKGCYLIPAIVRLNKLLSA